MKDSKKNSNENGNNHNNNNNNANTNTNNSNNNKHNNNDNKKKNSRSSTDNNNKKKNNNNVSGNVWKDAHCRTCVTSLNDTARWHLHLAGFSTSASDYKGCLIKPRPSMVLF